MAIFPIQYCKDNLSSIDLISQFWINLFKKYPKELLMRIVKFSFKNNLQNGGGAIDFPGTVPWLINYMVFILSPCPVYRLF